MYTLSGFFLGTGAKIKFEPYMTDFPNQKYNHDLEASISFGDTLACEDLFSI